MLTVQLLQTNEELNTDIVDLKSSKIDVSEDNVPEHKVSILSLTFNDKINAQLHTVIELLQKIAWVQRF